jgi:hypothetical protein
MLTPGLKTSDKDLGDAEGPKIPEAEDRAVPHVLKHCFLQQTKLK